MNNSEDYEFFTDYQKADVYHFQAKCALIEQFADTSEKRDKVIAIVKIAWNALLDILDGIHEKYCANFFNDQQTAMATI